MNQSDINNLLKTAISAAISAGVAIMNVYESEDFSEELKGDNSPLTQADLAAHRIIVDHLALTGIQVLSEEGIAFPYEERKKLEFLWIVDPLDGTKEFIARNGEFTVNIALIKNGLPILGVVFAPAIGELYFGSENEGSFIVEVGSLDGQIDFLLGKQRLPLAASEDRVFTVVASRSHLNEETVLLIDKYRKDYPDLLLRSFGSSLKLCKVASGLADVYPRLAPTMEWDTAAAHAVCFFAGCRVVSFPDKKELCYNKENLLNPWFVVSRTDVD